MLKITTKNAVFSIFFLLITLPACKNNATPQPSELLERGFNFAKKHKYESCIYNLEKIDDVSPYSTYSKSATPVLIYCNYMQGNFDSIHPMVEGFESLYPISNQLPYLYYIRTLAYFRVIGNYRKSMQNIENMFTMIHKLNNIAPESEYTQNVNKLIPYTVELQDKKDLYIAQNYLNMDNFISSGSRYSKLYTKTLDRQLKQNVEESMIDILKNLGIQE